MPQFGIYKQKTCGGGITYFQLNYVLQTANIAEMDKFVAYAEDLKCDRIAINNIEQWGTMSEQEYKESSVIENGKVKEGLEQYFTEELIVNDKINFHNLSNIVGAKPRLMYMI